MIHGMCCGAWAWDNYRVCFEKKGYHCIATTLRYHDIAPDCPPDPRLGTTSLLDYIADLEVEIGQLAEKPILIGHSMGALLAQILVSRGFGKAAVLLTPAPPAGVVSLKPSMVKIFLPHLTRWGFWRKPLRISDKAAVYGVLNRMPPETWHETCSHFVYESGRAAAEIGLGILARRRASEVNELSITCPVLVVGCTHDRMLPPSMVKKVARKYQPLSEYVEYPDHAHWLIAEPGWQDIAADIDRWIQRKRL